MNSTNNVMNTILTRIEQINIKERMLECYVDGFGGFEVFTNDSYNTLSPDERNRIMTVIKNKINESGYANKLQILTGDDGVIVSILYNN